MMMNHRVSSVPLTVSHWLLGMLKKVAIALWRAA